MGADWALSRLVLTTQGDLKATFSDGVILVLNSTADRFAVINQAGQVVQQLSRFALSQYLPKLAIALGFLNLHTDKPTYIAKASSEDVQPFSTGHAVLVSWPKSVTAACEAGLISSHSTEAGIQLEAEGSIARIVLHPHRQRMAVCYPLLIAQHEEGQKYEYIWHTQLFSCKEVPARWQPAWQLASSACQALDRAAGARPDSEAKVSNPDAQAGTSASGLHSSNARVSELPTALPQAQAVRGTAGVLTFEDPWWLDNGSSLLPTRGLLHFEWTPEATYQFLQGVQEVQAWIHADESCLETVQQGRFLRHHRGGMDEPRTFSADTVPSHAWDVDGRPCYPLASIASHACMLRKVCSACLKQEEGRQHPSLRESAAHPKPIAPGSPRQQHTPCEVPLPTAVKAADSVSSENSTSSVTSYHGAISDETGSPVPAAGVPPDWSHQSRSADHSIDDKDATLPFGKNMTQMQRNELVEACLAGNARMLAMFA